MASTHYICIGLQCSGPDALKKCGIRQQAYPFDWLWMPSRSALETLQLLLLRDGDGDGDDAGGIDAAVEHLSTGGTNCIYAGNESHVSPPPNTACHSSCVINAQTGVGVVHHTVDAGFRAMLRRRLERLLQALRSRPHVTLLYIDASAPHNNYRIDGVVHGTDATADLEAIHALVARTLRPPQTLPTSMLYFCWNERVPREQNSVVAHVGFQHMGSQTDVSSFVADQLRTNSKMCLV